MIEIFQYYILFLYQFLLEFETELILVSSCIHLKFIKFKRIENLLHLKQQVDLFGFALYTATHMVWSASLSKYQRFYSKSKDKLFTFFNLQESYLYSPIFTNTPFNRLDNNYNSTQACTQALVVRDYITPIMWQAPFCKYLPGPREFHG